MRKTRLLIVTMLLFSLSALPLVAEDAGQGGMDIGYNFSLGSSTFLTDGVDPVTYNKLAFKPELTLGEFGIGLDLVFHWRFNAGVDQNEFEWRLEDYWPSDPDQRLSAILSKFSYVRYGQKGSNLYAKIGSFEDGILGNGFIMSGYANTLFAPDLIMTGAALDIDGNLFGFPLIGIETFVSDITAFDLIGGRFFVRPLVYMDLGIFSDLQIGATVVVDNNPFRFDATLDPDPSAPDQALVWGVDFRQPIIDSGIISNAVFGDYVIENDTFGVMVGTGGRLLSFLDYGAQVRYLSDNFIPTYFDGIYDVERNFKYMIMNSATSDAAPSFGYFGYLGTSFLEEKILLSILIDGPFTERDPGAVAPNDFVNYPHMTGYFKIDKGIIPYTSIEAYYDKKYIRDFGSFISLEGALIGLKLSMYSGPIVATVTTDVKYIAQTGEFDVTTGLETTIEF